MYVSINSKGASRNQHSNLLLNLWFKYRTCDWLCALEIQEDLRVPEKVSRLVDV